MSVLDTPRTAAPFFASWHPSALFARLRHMPALFEQRRALAHLDDRALEDLGLTRADAMYEASRPVWDVPSHWLR